MLGSFGQLFEEETFNNNSWLMFFVAILISFRIFSAFQKEKPQFFYRKSSLLMRDFLKTSKIKSLDYTPWMLTLNGHW